MPTNSTTRNTWATTLITDAGSAAKLHLYNGAIPSNGGTPAGTLLAECTMASTLGTASAGVITLGTVTGDSSGNAAGTPTFVRILTSGNSWIGDYAISGFPAVVFGAAVDVTGGTITVGG